MDGDAYNGARSLVDPSIALSIVPGCFYCMHLSRTVDIDAYPSLFQTRFF